MRLVLGLLLCIALISGTLLPGCAFGSVAQVPPGSGWQGQGHVDPPAPAVDPCPGGACPPEDLSGAGVLPPASGERAGDLKAIVFHNWRGFALKDNRSLALKISLEGIRPLKPVNARKLMESNLSLEEIRDRICCEEGETAYQGTLKLQDLFYRLADIRIDPSDRSKSPALLEADLGDMKPGDPKGAALLGHLSLKQVRNGTEGDLILNSGPYTGRYKVILDA